MIGKYDRIDVVDIIYRDNVYPNTYLLTGSDVMSDFEVDLESSLDFNEMQASNRRTVCQLNDIYDLFDFMDAQGIYYRPYCMTPDTLLVGGEKDCLIQPDLTFDWANSIRASTVNYARQNYVKASVDDDDDDDDFDIDDMIDYIDAEWDNCGCGEKMTRKEAEYYLGHSVRGMSKEEVDDEVSELQRAYYTNYGDPGAASEQEVIDMYNYMINAKGE